MWWGSLLWRAAGPSDWRFGTPGRSTVRLTGHVGHPVSERHLAKPGSWPGVVWAARLERLKPLTSFGLNQVAFAELPRVPPAAAARLPFVSRAAVRARCARPQA